MRYRVGDVLDGYVLETECGSGAFGSVFLAKNRTLGQECALKILYKNGRQYEKELEGLPFSRCSLSYLVNLKRIDRISKETVIIGKHQLAISRNRKKEFLQAFTDYLEAGF